MGIPAQGGESSHSGTDKPVANVRACSWTSELSDGRLYPELSEDQDVGETRTAWRGWGAKGGIEIVRVYQRPGTVGIGCTFGTVGPVDGDRNGRVSDSNRCNGLFSVVASLKTLQINSGDER